MKMMITLLILCQVTPTAFGQSDGTRGGAEVTKKNGKYAIRDMVDPTVNTVVSGATLMDDPRLPFESVLSGVAVYNRFFALQIRRALHGMRFVYTTNLRAIKTDDPDGYTYSVSNNELVGIRTLGKPQARIDVRKIKLLPFREQAYIYIHETLHSFIDPGATNRNDKIRGLGKLVFSLKPNSKLLQRDFDASLEVFEVQTFVHPEANLVGKALELGTPTFTHEEILRLTQVPEVRDVLSPEDKELFFQRTGIIRYTETYVSGQMNQGSNLSNTLTYFRNREIKGRNWLIIGACYVTLGKTTRGDWDNPVATLTFSNVGKKATTSIGVVMSYPLMHKYFWDSYSSWGNGKQLLALLESGFCDRE